jgi:serine protease Do
MIDTLKNKHALLPCLLLLILTGCAHSPRSYPKHDEIVRGAQERAAQKSLDAVKNSLVLFKVEETGGDSRDNNRTASFSGIVLSEEGHLLAPYTIRPNSGNRIEAWIGDQRYLARALKYDETLGMTIVKIQPEAPLTPLDIVQEHELRPGQNAYTVVGSDEAAEFSRFVFKTFCQGMIEGRYRQLSLAPLPGTARGAPLFNPAGDVVGLVNQSNAWVLEDLIVDLNDLLARAKGEIKSEEDSEDAWFGAILLPINPDYAKANNLPRSAIWLIHVFENGSAADAGFKSGDLVIKLNGEDLRLSGARAYQYFMQTLRPRVGKEFSATVLRGKKEIEGKSVFMKQEDPDTLRAEDLGITLSEVTESMVVRLNLKNTGGVIVTNLDPGSPAATGRSFGDTLLRPRDLIVSIGGIPTPNIEAFSEALDQIRQEKRKELLVQFWRGPISGYEALNLRIGERDNGGQL